MPRLSAQERATLDRLAAELRRRFGARLAAVTLFGSRARGEGRDDSDLDVLVLVRALTRDERRAVIDFAADLGVESGLVLSLLVADAARFSADLPLARAVAAEGVPL